MKESDILYEDADKKYYVIAAKYGYDVYQNGLTHATRIAHIGYLGEKGLQRAIEEIDIKKKMTATSKL